jgi:acyl-CoA synthetase (NDP forming)
LRFSKVVSIGNQVDLAAADYLDYLGADPQTRVIGAYLEGIPNGRDFLRRVGETSARKPVIIWKAGKTGAGARAVASHTASLAGSYSVWDAAFKQAGVIGADHLDELIDFVAAFGCPYLPAGKRVGVIGEAGGGGAAACDACEAIGLHIYEFPGPVQQELREALVGAAAPFSSVRNPVDLVSPRRSEYPRLLPQCLEVMASAVDALLFFTYHPLTDATFLDIMERLRDKIGKPVFVVPGYAEGRARFAHAGAGGEGALGAPPVLEVP